MTDRPPAGGKKVPTGIGLRPSMRDRLDEIAVETGRSRSYVVEQAIERFLRQYQPGQI